MEKKRVDIERIRRYFNGDNKADFEYIRKIFTDQEYEDELEPFLRREWYELSEEKNQPDKNLDHILFKLNYDINNMRPERRIYSHKAFIWFSRIAAVLILPLLIYFTTHFTRSTIKPVYTELHAPAWSRIQFSLPDGTKGWLNSNSSLRYESDFKNNRNVTLNGEAYFDVERDKRKPFRVIASDVQVTVLGTRFNVESLDNSVEVTLEEGKLEYYNKDLDKTFSMLPNDCIFYDNATGLFKVDVVQTEKYVSWKDGKLVFRNDPLDIVAKRLARWYNIDVEIKGDISDQPALRATFVDENLEEVLRLLKLSLSIDYIIQKPEKLSGETYTKTKVIITPKK